jgi:capsid protein
VAVSPHRPAQAAAFTAGDRYDRVMRDWAPSFGSADADLIPELGTIVPRARDLGRNNGVTGSGYQTLRDNIVRHVLKLRAKPYCAGTGFQLPAVYHSHILAAMLCCPSPRALA